MDIVDWFGNLKKTKPVLFWILVVIIGVLLVAGAVLTAGLLIVVVILIARYYKNREKIVEINVGGLFEDFDKKDIAYTKKKIYSTNNDVIRKIEFYNKNTLIVTSYIDIKEEDHSVFGPNSKVNKRVYPDKGSVYVYYVNNKRIDEEAVPITQ